MNNSEFFWCLFLLWSNPRGRQGENDKLTSFYSPTHQRLHTSIFYTIMYLVMRMKVTMFIYINLQASFQLVNISISFFIIPLIGALSVMVIVLRNRPGDLSSNPGRSCLHFSTRYIFNYSPFSYGLIMGQTELFNFVMITYLGEGKLWNQTCQTPSKN